MTTLSQIMHIAAREVACFMRDARFVTAFVVVTVLVTVSVAVNVHSYVQKKREYDQSQASYTREVFDKGYTQINFHNLPKQVAREPQLTQIIALAGEYDPDSRAAIKVEYSPWFSGNLRRNPLPGLLFPFDLVLIVGLLMPLLAFALTYDTFTANNQREEQRVLMAGPVARSTVILGKWLGAVIAMLIPYTLAAWCAATVLAVSASSVPITSADIAAMSTFYVLGVAYIAVMVSLSIAVSSFFSNPGAAVVCLLFVWLIGFVALPYSAATGMYAFKHQPAVQALEDRVDYAGNILVPSDTARHFNDFWEGKIPVQDAMLRVCQAQTRAESHLDNIAAAMRRASPYGCFLNASIALANTGFSRERQFREGLEQYYRSCLGYAASIGGWDQPFDRSGMPQPAFRTPAIIDRLNDSLLDIALMALIGTLSFLIAYRNFMRRDIV